ncbi:hypothetical protein HYPP_03236 [Hyphomicrobium sp. ghe19]|nr:hypothetical protein HYPP_03236 [Hyphomicrobium sp. ghe19]
MTGSYRDLEFDRNSQIILTKPFSAKNFVVRLHSQFALFLRRCIASIHGALLNIELRAAAIRVVDPLILAADVVYFLQKRAYPLSTNNNSLFVEKFKCPARSADTHAQFVSNFGLIGQ